MDLVPGEWTKVKIQVLGDKARLFVHGVEQPTLLVNDLKQGQSKGAIALWVGPGNGRALLESASLAVATHKTHNKVRTRRADARFYSGA